MPHIKSIHTYLDAVVAVEGGLGLVHLVGVPRDERLDPRRVQVRVRHGRHEAEGLGLQPRPQGAVLVEQLGLDGQARAVRHVCGGLVHLVAGGRGRDGEGADLVLSFRVSRKEGRKEGVRGQVSGEVDESTCIRRQTCTYTSHMM